MVNTRAGSRYGQDDYVSAGCGMGLESTLYLLEKGVKLTGTDAWSWDAPFVHTAEKFKETHDASLIWEGHKAGRHKAYCHIVILSSGKASQSGSPARQRFYCSLLPGKNPWRFCRVDPGSSDYRLLG